MRIENNIYCNSYLFDEFVVYMRAAGKAGNDT